MALLGNPVAQNATNKPAQVESEVEVEAGSAADKKAKKLEALKRFKERKAQKAVEDYQSALALRDELSKVGLLEKLTDRSKAFLADQCTDPATRKQSSAGGVTQPSVLIALYGPSPKVGDKITLRQAFEKTAKGKATLDILIRRWKEKGTVVEVIPNKDIMETVYEIKALPAA
jgi:hypothetical protein